MQCFIEKGFQHIKAKPTSFDALVEHHKAYCIESDSAFCCAAGSFGDVDMSVINIAEQLVGPVQINHRDLFYGMLYAIGIDDVEKIGGHIGTFAQSPLNKRLGVWRQFLIEDQVRYLETLLHLEHPCQIAEQFMLNPQAKKGVRELSKLFKRKKDLVLSFGHPIDRNELYVFSANNDEQKLRGARLIRPSCVGFQLTGELGDA